MSFFSLLMLALIQGLTEFLPVSSSAHLELWHVYIGQTGADLALDVAVHVGTLAAVCLYFRVELGQATRGFGQIIRGQFTTIEAHLALCLIIATIPVVIAGAVLKLTDTVDLLRSLAVMGWAMILFGGLLWWMDRTGAQDKPAGAWTLRDAALLGLWQALALIPGTSRSGAAITGALALGYDRQGAAKIAMLMSIPTIAASGVLLGAEVAGTGAWSLAGPIAIAAALSFCAGLFALTLMMRLLRTVNYTPYVIYRVILGIILLSIAYS